ncbi:MAG: hypothetical protein MJY59_01675 [Bacteroidaceae bacterium]|nr:hypothetical protein [Bacteroidaceae bacterium]
MGEDKRQDSVSSRQADMSQRAKWHDYRDKGWYMVTMVTEGRRHLFGKIVGGEDGRARMVLSELGECLVRELSGQSVRRRELVVRAYVVMPDHCHILVQITAETEWHLGQMVWGIKYGTTAAYLRLLDRDEGGRHSVRQSAARDRRHEGTGRSVSARSADNEEREGREKREESDSVVSAACADKDLVLVAPLWEAGYHDRIVKRYGQIATLKAYISRNIERAWLKANGQGWLNAPATVEVAVSIDDAQALKDFAVFWDSRREVTHSAFSVRRHYSESYVELVGKFLRRRVRGVSARSADNEGREKGSEGREKGSEGREKGGEVFMRMRAVGNRWMLEAGRPLVAVRMSRSMSAEKVEEEVSRMMDMCEREGAIVVSPFISPGEKRMREAVMENGYCAVQIYGERMGERWHPDQNSEVAVEEGRLLYLGLWPDRPGSEKVTKPDMEVMNQVARMMERNVRNREEESQRRQR